MKDRAAIQLIAHEICDRKIPWTFPDAIELDKRLRALFRDSNDLKVQDDAYGLWCALWETWILHLKATGKAEEAKELERLTSDFKEKHEQIAEAKRMLANPDFIERLLSQ
jgi:hypothetical protein